jgi:hypothetical protein
VEVEWLIELELESDGGAAGTPPSLSATMLRSPDKAENNLLGFA